jgi:FKBP-type peptidyl-prolyl cis-trans isomerase SlyD
MGDVMQIDRDTVASFRYTLKDADGFTIEESPADDPIVYLHGHGNILPALEEQLAGHAAGERVVATLSPEQAYGKRIENAGERIPIKHVRFQGRLAPGMRVAVESGKGMRQVTVLKVGKFNVDVDVNHPLAGKTLTFEIDLLDVRAATGEELTHGHAHGPGGHHHH